MYTREQFQYHVVNPLVNKIMIMFMMMMMMMVMVMVNEYDVDDKKMI